MKKKAMKKAAALLLSAAITACMVPAVSFADDAASTSTTTTTTQSADTITNGDVTTVDSTAQLTDSVRSDLKSVLENYDTSAYDTAEADKIKSAEQTAETALDSAATMQDANKVLSTFYVTVSKLDTKEIKELKAANAAYTKKVSSHTTKGYSKTNTKKIKNLKTTYLAKIKAAKSVDSVKSLYKTFKTKADAVPTVKQQNALTKTKKLYITKIRRYSVTKAPKKAQSKIKSAQNKAVKAITSATSTTAVKSAYNTFSSTASSAVKAAKTSTSTSSSTNFLYTADGKKVYVGKTYNTSYWGDKYSNRTIKVTYIPKIVPDVDGWYNGGDFIIGVDVNNGGVYNCTINTAKNTEHKDYEHGLSCDSIVYNAYLKPVSGKGYNISPEDVTKRGNGAASWLSNADNSEAIKILKDNITIVETIDGTEPTLDHYYAKYTKASTNGETFSTYKWGFDTTGTQWIRMYEGSRVIYEQVFDLISWDE